MWARNDKRLNMNRSQAISRDARAVRSDCATHELKHAVRITRLLFEIPILCLRCSWLQRKSTKNRSTSHENEAQIDQTSTKIRTGAGLGAQSRFGNASGRACDGFWTPKCRPKTYLGASRAAQERPVAPQDALKTSQAYSRSVSKASRIAHEARLWHRTLSETCFHQFLIEFRSMRGTSETRFVLVFTMFF